MPIQSKPRLALWGLVLLASLLQGCGPLVVAGATYGGALIHERRSAQTVWADDALELRVKNLLAQNPEINQRSRINATSYNLSVLLTGQAQTRAISRQFANQVSELANVRLVYNEIEIGPNIGLSRISADTYLTSRAKLALTMVDLPDFDITRVKVTTENAVVYLMGLVTREEADAVVERVRRIPGVERVVRIFEYI